MALEFVRNLPFGLHLPNFLLDFVVPQSRSYGYGIQGWGPNPILEYVTPYPKENLATFAPKANPQQTLRIRWVIGELPEY